MKQLTHSSDLVIERFFIADTTILSIFPEEGQRVRLKSLKIAGDFDIFISEKNDKELTIVINFNIKCNEDEKPGYFFDISAVGEFVLKHIDKIEDKIEQQYVLYTALPMVINSLRTYIQSITCMHSFGPYMLPAVDLNEMIQNKFSSEPD